MFRKLRASAFFILGMPIISIILINVYYVDSCYRYRLDKTA